MEVSTNNGRFIMMLAPHVELHDEEDSNWYNNCKIGVMILKTYILTPWSSLYCIYNKSYNII